MFGKKTQKINLKCVNTFKESNSSLYRPVFNLNNIANSFQKSIKSQMRSTVRGLGERKESLKAYQKMYRRTSFVFYRPINHGLKQSRQRPCNVRWDPIVHASTLLRAVYTSGNLPPPPTPDWKSDLKLLIFAEGCILYLAVKTFEIYASPPNRYWCIVTL
jgi:hypothetical protein